MNELLNKDDDTDQERTLRWLWRGKKYCGLFVSYVGIIY